MISFTSKTFLFPQPKFVRWRLDESAGFVEDLPPNTIRFQSWRKTYLLSPDLEAYARRESDEIDPKYGLGWVLLAKIARNMHDSGTLRDPPQEAAHSAMNRRGQEVVLPYGAQPPPGMWHRMLVWLGCRQR